MKKKIKKKWSKFKALRIHLLTFLIAETNKLKQEAVFKEDLDRVIEFQKIVSFLTAFNNNMYHWTCPMCGTRRFIHAEIDNVDFDSERYKDYPQYGTHEHYDKLHISKCQNCGWYTIAEF